MANRILNNLFSPTFILIHVTLAFGLGISLSSPLLSLNPLLLSATLGLGLTALVTSLATPKKNHILAIIFFLFTGVCHGSYALAPNRPNHHIANIIQKQTEVALIGVVAQAVEYGIDKSTLIIECQQIFIPPADHLPNFPNKQEAPLFQKTTGRAKISMRRYPSDQLWPGDRVITRAKIGPPQGFNNLGSFDLNRFLASKNILITGWINSPQSIIKLEDHPSALREIAYGPEQLRAKLINFLRANLPEKQSALYRALITGDKTGLQPETMELFRSLGIVHLLAISGLHMAFLAGAVIALSLWLLKRSQHILNNYAAHKIAACAAILPLTLYCLVAGLQTPALRALIMILIFISALLSDRPWHGPTNISLAALLILAINPLAITTVSFQLSFAAVTGIILILPQVQHLFTNQAQVSVKYKLKGYLLGSLFVSLAASLATLPLLLYHFNRFSLSGPWATIAIEPFLCIWGLGWGLAASLATPLFPDLAILLFKTGGLGLDAALFIAQILKPMATSIWLPTPSLAQVIIYYTGLFLIITSPKLLAKIPAAICCLWLFIPLKTSPVIDQATILDVGQGNCTVIETSNGKVAVIDAGGPRSPTLDIGRQVIAPALWAKGIRSIDLLVLSHPDQDHFSGAAFLLSHFSPKTMWIPATTAKDPEWQKILTLAATRQTVIRTPTLGESYQPFGPERQLICLSGLHLSSQETQNNQSLVIKFTSAGRSLLMPGDIEKKGERELVNGPSNLDSDFIIAPHHGSASSSSNMFLRQVTPDTVIFSASRYKKPHFPSQEVSERYRLMGASTMATSESGAITIYFEPNGLITTTRQ